MKSKWLFTAVLVGSAGLAGCQTVQTTAPGAIGIERKQQMMVSSEQVDEAAAQAYTQEVQTARAKASSTPMRRKSIRCAGWRKG